MAFKSVQNATKAFADITMTCYPPAAAVAGDFWVLVVAANACSVSSVSAGWTLVNTDSSADGANRLYIYEKTPSAGDANPCIVTLSNASSFTSGALLCYNSFGHVSTNAGESSPTSTSVVVPSGITLNANDNLLTVICGVTASGPTVYSWPGDTERNKYSNAGLEIAVADRTVATPQTVLARTVSLTGGSWNANSQAAQSLVIKAGSITHTAQATLTGTSGGTKTGAVTLGGQATIAGAASPVPTGQVTRLAATLIAGAGAATPTGQITRLAAAMLGGAGSVSATPVFTSPAVATIAATSTIAPTGQITRLGAATLAGGSTAIATATVVQILRPIEDILNQGDNGSWSSTAVSNMWSVLDDIQIDDADYVVTVVSPQQAVAEVRLQPGQLPQGGTVRIIFRARTL